MIKIKSLGKSLKTKLESSSDVAKKKVKNTRKTKVDDDSVDAITKKGHTEVSADNPITNKARLKKLADHTEVASVPDYRVRSFANEKFNDPDFLKKLELDKLIPTEYYKKNGKTMDDVLISFKEAMLKSEHKRQQFVIEYGNDFKSDPKLLKKYYDEDLEILQKPSKKKLASYEDFKYDNNYKSSKFIPRYR